MTSVILITFCTSYLFGTLFFASVTGIQKRKLDDDSEDEGEESDGEEKRKPKKKGRKAKGSDSDASFDEEEDLDELNSEAKGFLKKKVH